MTTDTYSVKVAAAIALANEIGNIVERCIATDEKEEYAQAAADIRKLSSHIGSTPTYIGDAGSSQTGPCHTWAYACEDGSGDAVVFFRNGYHDWQLAATAAVTIERGDDAQNSPYRDWLVDAGVWNA